MGVSLPRTHEGSSLVIEAPQLTRVNWNSQQKTEVIPRVGFDRDAHTPGRLPDCSWRYVVQLEIGVCRHDDHAMIGLEARKRQDVTRQKSTVSGEVHSQDSSSSRVADSRVRAGRRGCMDWAQSRSNQVFPAIPGCCWNQGEASYGNWRSHGIEDPFTVQVRVFHSRIN